MAASLLASPDRLRVAWLHLFAAGNPPGTRAAWDRLWPETKTTLIRMDVPSVWVMTTEDWLIDLLSGSGFIETGRVVAYSLRPSHLRPVSARAAPITPMQESDLVEVEQLDHAAFSPPWQMDSEALQETRERSILATIFRREGKIAGYLMASHTPHGVHLTRVAVLPQEQNKGVGRLLITHLLNYLHHQGAPRITVNTQIENRRSRRLYRALGFAEMGESYPVFRIDLRPA